MRRILVASLIFSPLFIPAAAIASSPASDASIPTQARPVSTGVTPAHVIRSTDIEISADTRVPNEAEVGLQLRVDEKGLPADVQVVKSVNPELDARVVEAVRQFRFRPATLDHQAIPIDMTLNILVQR